MTGLTFLRTLFAKSPEPTSDEIADLIEKFIANDPTLDKWAWDDFTSSSYRDPRITEVAALVSEMADKYPHGKHWCSDEGLEVLRQLATRLRGEKAW